mmetsp:Transcript_1/g.7  ORF Transcript_1/g.7 Transcript_1/m.7 type:complete len:226 (-) Transcript_1:354-1031(-)
MSDHPCAVRSTRADTTAAIPDHTVQSEELCVVVIQIVNLVLHLMEVLGALRETHILIELHLIVEKVWDGAVEEIRLELVPGIANAVETRRKVTGVAVHVFRLVRIEAQVVLAEIQTACLAATGPERHIVHEVVIIFQAINHLPSIGTQLQPVLVVCILWDLVVPGSWSHMLRLDRPLVLHGLGPCEIVQAKRQAVAILRLPVCHVVQMKVFLFLLEISQVLLQCM